MTAVAREHFEDLGFGTAIDEVASHLGDKVYNHYFLDISDTAYGKKSPVVFLEFSEIESFLYNLKCYRGFRTTTCHTPRYVEFERVMASINTLNRDLFFSNLIAASVEEAIERFEDKKNCCFTIGFQDTDLTVNDFYRGFKELFTKYLDDGSHRWCHDSNETLKTISLYTV